MANFSILQKQQYCKELDEFTENTEKYLKQTCSYLDWDFNKINENDTLFITCPFNKAHRVPEKTIETHLEKCEWNILGYTKNCIPLSKPTLLPNNPSTIKFDMELQQKVLQTAKQKNPELNIGIDEKLIPQTSDRLLSDFTNDERKAMYEYVISNTIAPDIGQDVTDINKPEKLNNQSTPIIELLAQERNLKRRRTKHKGVHTNKKSHIEILRELVEQQMEMFKEHISEKFGIPISKDIREDIYLKYNENKISEYSILQNNEKNLLEKRQFYNKIKQDSKFFNEKLKKRIKSDQNYSTNYKHSSHHKSCDYKSSSKDQNAQNSLRHNKSYDKNKSAVKYNHKYEIQYKFSNKNRDYTDFRHCKHDKNKSNEKIYNDISEYNSQGQRHNKKHIKIHKKKRENYLSNKDERNHKRFIHKRDKYN